MDKKNVRPRATAIPSPSMSKRVRLRKLATVKLGSVVKKEEGEMTLETADSPPTYLQ
jgi:hypothetical protein